MSFQISALPAEDFAPFFAMDDAELAAHRAVRVIADADDSFPCRVSLEDAAKGDTLILVNHLHLDTASPYRASHAVYVREGAQTATPAPDEIPQMLAHRLLSVRALDEKGFIRSADVVEGTHLRETLTEFLADPQIAFVDIHIAKPGCFAARATRA